MATISSYSVPVIFANRCQGRVHSVFAHSYNVACWGLKDESNQSSSLSQTGTQLVHFGCDLSFLSCFGIALDPAQLAEVIAHVHAEDLVVCSEGVCRFYTHDGPITIDLSTAEVRCLKVLARNWDFTQFCLVRDVVHEHVQELGVLYKSAFHTDAKAYNALFSLQAHMGAYEMAELMNVLVGRGLGLTPSGDDALVGYGCALAMLKCNAAFTEALRMQKPSQTVDIAYAYLKALLDGYASSPLIELTRACCELDVLGIGRASRRLLSLGHTSGADTLIGFDCALQNISAPECRRFCFVEKEDVWHQS